MPHTCRLRCRRVARALSRPRCTRLRGGAARVRLPCRLRASIRTAEGFQLRFVPHAPRTAQMDMEDGDSIDAMMEQVGGRGANAY